MIKFAFSTQAFPQWDLQTIINAAKEYSCNGVDISLPKTQAGNPSAFPLQVDPTHVKQAFADAGITICALGTSIAFTHDKTVDNQSAQKIRQTIDLAVQLNCRLVTLLGTQVKPRQSRAAVALSLGDWLMPLGDYAAHHGISIGLENALSFRAARDIWQILERMAHPAIGCCWNLLNALLIGESPAVSIPTLNSRIIHVRARDAKIGPAGAIPCPLGQGNALVEQVVKRLRGIGYVSYLTLQCDESEQPQMPPSIQMLREWTTPREISDALIAAKKKV